jgi:S1-C subfamily serine protease
MRRRTFALTLALLAMFAIGITMGRLLPVEDQAPRPSPAPAAAITRAPSEPLPIPDELGPDERNGIEIYRRASGSVVHITTRALQRSFFSELYEVPQGTGSGFFWDDQGHVVTNFHVIEGANAFTVTMADHSDWEAQLVGAAPDKDLAVLRIEAPRERLVPLPLGRSDRLLVGQKVLAVGNPFGLDQTLTVGIVSALERELQSPAGRVIRDVVQTDAAINPGNSGGPLLDSGGRVIGVNTAIYSPSGASAGIGFAIPVDTVRRLVPQLIDFGRPLEPGIEGLVWLSERQARYFGLEGVGVVVREVERGSQAEQSGFEGIGVDRRGRYVLGDIIVGAQAADVHSPDELLDAFEAAGIGTRVRLRVSRDRREREVEVELKRIGQDDRGRGGSSRSF